MLTRNLTHASGIAGIVELALGHKTNKQTKQTITYIKKEKKKKPTNRDVMVGGGSGTSLAKSTLEGLAPRGIPCLCKVSITVSFISSL